MFGKSGESGPRASLADREDPRPREFLRPGFVGGRPLRDAGRPAGEARFESQKKQSSMILADTSVSIEFLNGSLGSGIKEDTFQVVTCLPVIQEIFEGLRGDLPSGATEGVYDSIVDRLPDCRHRHQQQGPGMA